ncbi:MAG: potassium-transporting ATPase subunit KdpA [Phycisphaerales bacterium]
MLWTLPILLILGCIVLSVPLGRYMAWALADAPAGLRARLDAIVQTIGGSRAAREQRWRAYTMSMLVFNAIMFVLAFVLLTTQTALPLNPDGKASMPADLAFNTAASFTTNTNLQHYSGEQSLSYFSQLFVVMWLQFVSAATGITALAALCRGLSGKSTLGNYYRDMARVTMLVLLPMAFLAAVALIACSVPMTLEGAAVATTLEGLTQTIARGPVAAIVSIKQLGTNGGGFFGPNSTHPFENPDFVSNVIENASIILIPMACVWMFGRLIRSWKQAAVVFAAMLALYTLFTGFAVVTEQAPASALDGLAVQQTMNLEGKELRFGSSASSLWAVSTTSTSNGSVNAMHDSLNPLTGLFPMIGMWLNVEFGGVGVGFINMFLFIITSVFIAGMMVGRTPEYLGKKVEAREMKLALLALLAHPLFILAGVALFAATPLGRSTTQDPGPHGLSEIIYEFSSSAANNGSGFEGLADNTPAWNIATGLVMLLARFLPIILPLAIAGSLASKRRLAESAGTFRTDAPLFGVVLLGVVLIVGALLFLPLGMLGPVAEHLALTGATAGGQ